MLNGTPRPCRKKVRIEKTVAVGGLVQDRHTFMIIYRIEGNFGDLVKLIKIKIHQYRLLYATVKQLGIEILDLVEEIQQAADSFKDLWC